MFLSYIRIGDLKILQLKNCEITVGEGFVRSRFLLLLDEVADYCVTITILTVPITIFWKDPRLQTQPRKGPS